MSKKSDIKKFKKKIRKTLYHIAPLYHSYYSENKYLVYSPEFKNRPYYIITGGDVNFLHLTGLGTDLNPYDFYKKCENHKLKDEDFKVSYRTKDGVHVRNDTIESKLEVLPNIIGIFNKDVSFQEDFTKGQFISCGFALGEETLTIGFCVKKYCTPQTLLKKNYIKEDKAIKPTLILSGSRGATAKFDTIIKGDLNIVKDNVDILNDLISDNLKDKIK